MPRGSAWFSWPGSVRSFAHADPCPPHILTVRRCLPSQAVRIGELRYSSFLVSIAQRPRAILFAKAIATSIFGFLASICVNHAFQALPLRPAHRMTAIAPMTSSRRISLWPIFDTRPRRSLPPVEFCRGTSPSQAAKSRPDRNCSNGGAKLRMARAVTGPTPGMVRRRATYGVCAATSLIRRERDARRRR